MGDMAPPPPPMNGYSPYPYPDEYAPAPKKGPSKIILTVIAILGILAVAIAILTLTADSGNKTGNTPQNQTPTETEDKSAKDIIDRSDGTLDLSSKLTLSKSLKAQKVQGNIKQQVNLSSGFSFMVNKIEDYTSPNPTTKPAEGKKFIVLTTVVGNRLNTGNLSVSYLDFRLRDDNNNIIPGHVTTNEILSNLLSSPGEIKPGEQITGKVIFEVEAADTSWVYRHSETYQKTTDNTTFNVEGEIVVSQSTATSETSGTDTSTTPTPTPATN